MRIASNIRQFHKSTLFLSTLFLGITLASASHAGVTYTVQGSNDGGATWEHIVSYLAESAAETNNYGKTWKQIATERADQARAQGRYKRTRVLTDLRYSDGRKNRSPSTSLDEKALQSEIDSRESTMEQREIQLKDQVSGLSKQLSGLEDIEDQIASLAIEYNSAGTEAERKAIYEEISRLKGNANEQTKRFDRELAETSRDLSNYSVLGLEQSAANDQLTSLAKRDLPKKRNPTTEQSVTVPSARGTIPGTSIRFNRIYSYYNGYDGHVLVVFYPSGRVAVGKGGQVSNMRGKSYDYQVAAKELKQMTERIETMPNWSYYWKKTAEGHIETNFSNYSSVLYLKSKANRSEFDVYLKYDSGELGLLRTYELHTP